VSDVPWWLWALVGGGAGIVGFGLGVLAGMLGLVAWGAAQVEMSRTANTDEGMLGEDLGWEREGTA
jgi:hypothetical protein